MGGQNPLFSNFFRCFLELKFERCFESKNLRKKRQTDAGVTHFGPGRRNVRGAGERKREGFRSLLGQNSGKNILGKHFRCKKIEKELALLIQHARPRWGGGVGPALRAGRPVVAIWSAASFARICFKLALL